MTLFRDILSLAAALFTLPLLVAIWTGRRPKERPLPLEGVVRQIREF